MKNITTASAPTAIGPYSQAIETNHTIYVSGQLPIDPVTGAFPSEDIRDQTRVSLSNVKAILEQAGLSMTDVVKTTVLLADMEDFSSMNEVYSAFFSQPYPARAAFQVARLPRDAKVEIEVVAEKRA